MNAQRVVIGKCDRALGWKACGEAVAHFKKLRDESRTNFSISRVISPQNRMHIAQSLRGVGRGDQLSNLVQHVMCRP